MQHYEKGATMAGFRVTQVVDGDTFDVTPDWQWSGQTGSRVRPTGYDAPEIDAPGGQVAKAKLERLILGKQVELGAGSKVDRGRLVCDVLLNGKDLADYFPEYR
jgi:endonuclease YncB( thermonuclease family)